MKRVFIFLVLGMFMISFGSAALIDDILSYYKLDDSSDPILDSHDSNPGTNNGATPGVTGIIETAYDFEKSESDYISFGDNLDITTGNLSISVWIKRESITNGDNWIMAKDDNIKGREYSFGISGTNTIDLQINGVQPVSQSSEITDTTSFHHIVVTFDDSTNAVKFYINGTLDTTTTNTGVLSSNTAEARMGAREFSGSEGFFDGVIDEVGIWDSILSQDEVTELYNSGSGFTYPFGENEIIVNIITPENESVIDTSDINFTANFTSSTNNFTNATYFIWYENGTTFNQTLVVLPDTNETNYTLQINDFEFDEYKWNVYVCVNNGDCSFAENNNSFSVLPFSVDAVTYNKSVYETSTQTYIINISANPTVNSVSGLFWYNGSSYTALITNPSSGKYVALSTIDTPLQDSTGNMTFKWQFDFELTDSSEKQQNTTDYSNQVNRTFIRICNETYTSEFMNFTIRNAENPFPKVDGTFKSAWQWYLGTGNVFRNMSYEDVTETKSDFDFCGSDDDIKYIFTVDIEADATGFSKNFYYFTEAEKTSGTATETDLYLLNDTLSTPTTLLVRDRYQRVIEDVLIFVQLYDVGTDTFYTVTMGNTNQNGEDIVYLNWFDSLYRFILVESGTTILTTEPYKVGDTPQIFQIEDDIVYDFDKFRDFEYSLTFNNDTSNFVLTYIKPSGLVESGCLRVINRDATGDTEICETCSTSASATLYCNIASAGNGTFIATFYATGSLAVIDWIIEEIGIGMSGTIFNLLDKDDAAFYTILMSSIVLLIFLISPVFGIIGILAGLLLSSALGFSLISYASFLFISIVGVTIIWLLRR